MKKSMSLILAVVCAFGLLVAGCGGEKKATEQPVLRVGMEPTFAPFEFQKEGSKEYDGFDMDLARAIGKQLNMKVEIVSMGFDGLIPALNAGSIDAIASGMTITPERSENVTFSEPYYKSGLTVMVREDEKEIQGIEDLKGKKIAVQIGTTGAMEAHKIEGATVVEFNANTEAALELKNGGVSAVVNDLPVVAYFLEQGGGKEYAKMVGHVVTSEEYGIAVKKGNDKLVGELNKALAELKKNGEYDKIYKTWFGEQVK
ncbi:MAG TPA: basic amino acid ABC transporter substrate-binding protein [Candidatus Avacidaminococcus intestinavium]|uniref:Basic amino acid ABC transporter substrate-binding protein n=1 Tax=Candidatus Avacidaminococcus intestinavium TaxID=2840684 RepID=A0A9D1MNK3_9FIRM|nr:basic amino acid ABC transporter substrate-binding protein [Candidatus Avacidaminococcus intestinavium]